MKVLLIAGGAVLLVVAIVVIIGASLPRRHEASRSTVISAPPAEVYRAITDFANAPSWRKETQRVEVLGQVNGRLRFREHGRHGAITYEVAAQEPPRLLVTEIVDRNLGYSGSWTYAIEPEASGSRVTITERGEASNVIFRFMARYVFGYTKTIDDYLAALAAHLH